MQLRAALLAAVGLLALTGSVLAQDHLVGVGIYDITGPAAQINMMGYANPSQTTKGIHLRLFARAFVMVDGQTSKRLAFVNTDLAFVTELIKMKVVERLQTVLPGFYTDDNVALTATHTHSGPGGYSQYILYQFTSLGFVENNFEAIVDGIVEAIRIAHNNVRSATMKVNVGQLSEANVNRSPYAYDQNPAEERAQYAHNTDLDFTQVRIDDVRTGEPMGLLNWFAVHATSMNNTNRLISSDNKGYAEYLFEQLMNGDDVRPGKGAFVAGFCSSNLGDISPNIKGAFCNAGPNQGLPCDYATSTCPNEQGRPRTQLCTALGPMNTNDKENTRIIGERQFNKAYELFQSGGVAVNGSVDYRHTFVTMEGLPVTLEETGETVKLCAPAMGYSFAGGTTDGPGFFNFHQGDTNGSPFWDRVRDFLKEPSQEMLDCQYPKPVLLPTGEVSRPHLWHPKILPLQLVKFGQVIVLVAPGEFSTMAGRRLRNTIRSIFQNEGGIANPTVVITGLSNTYSHYIVTKEEYSVQRYEAASCIYGPNSLAGYQQEFSKLARAMIRGESVDPGTYPPDLSDDLISLQPRVQVDTVPAGVNFGDLVEDVQASYTRGSLVQAVFWGGNPRTEFRIGDSFLDVERHNGTTWSVHRNDADWETEFRWEPLEDTETFMQHITMRWQTNSATPTGTYRLKYNGHYNAEGDRVIAFTGYSSQFTVV